MKNDRSKYYNYKRGPQTLYKGHFFIVFYDKEDENLLYMFDNAREILKFQGKEITRNNVCRTNVNIYRALKTDTHITRFLTGEPMRLYIIDMEDDENE